MLSIVALSERRYVVAYTQTESVGHSNLALYSHGKVGEPGEMIEIPRTTVLTKKGNYDTALYLFCLLTRKVELTEEEWEKHILPDHQELVARNFQPR